MFLYFLVNKKRGRQGKTETESVFIKIHEKERACRHFSGDFWPLPSVTQEPVALVFTIRPALATANIRSSMCLSEKGSKWSDETIEKV